MRPTTLFTLMVLHSTTWYHLQNMDKLMKRNYTIKLDQSTRDQLAVLAERHKRTSSDVVRLLLEYSLEKYRRSKEGNKAGVDLLRLLELSETSANGSSKR